MPITQEKTTQRRKYRIYVNLRYKLDKQQIVRKDEYAVTCGESVSANDAWRHEHARIIREEVPAGATEVNLHIRTEVCR